jgi:uncharacterized membrane protein YsdA (DUF1294 family)/cold shock CspA family protein
MRSQGTLTSWNDERGFGFITPDDGSRQVFVHINSLAHRGRRPEISQAVRYELSSDHKGRPCAENVLFADERRGVGFGSFLIAVLFLVAVAIAAFHLNKIPRLIFDLYVVASLLAFLIYAKDKSAAKSGSWRTPESTLHLISLFCGWPGALIAQQTLRHKSKKQSFRFVFWVTVVLNCGAVAFLFIPEVAIEVQYWLDVKFKFWISNVAKPFFLNLTKQVKGNTP